MGATALALLVPGAATASHNGDIHTDNVRVVAHRQFDYGTDLAFRGNTVVAGAADDWDGPSPDSGIHLFSAGKPASPVETGFSHCPAWHSDVGVWRNLVVQSNDDPGANSLCAPGLGAEGVRVFDISDTSHPRSVGFAPTIHGAHNLSVVGDTGLVYVSSYNLTDPTDLDGVSIVDIAADPVNPPVTFLEFPDLDSSPDYPDMRNDSGDPLPDSPGCHDIGIDMTRALAYCAAITETMIWDISDPRNPVIIALIRNPIINIHHGAYDNKDGDVLVLQDEYGGASAGPAACLAPNEPAGGYAFYDVADPRRPQFLSYWSPPDAAPTDDFCTSHFFGTFPDRDWLVGSWYDEGIYIVDFTDPRAPREVGHYDPGGNSAQSATFWSAYPYKGYLYANSFAPATLDGHDAANDYGGLWVFALDGYTGAKNRHR